MPPVDGGAQNERFLKEDESLEVSHDVDAEAQGEEKDWPRGIASLLLLLCQNERPFDFVAEVIERFRFSVRTQSTGLSV